MDEPIKIDPPDKFSEEGFSSVVACIASTVSECRGLLKVIQAAKTAGPSMKHNSLYQLSLKRFRDNARDIAARVCTISSLFGESVRDDILSSLGCTWIEKEQRVNFGKA